MAPESFQLVMRTGPTPGKAFKLTMNEVYVGRDITNEIVINDPEVSRKHARLTLQAGGGYTLEDLGSTNGTFVDGQRITGPHLLASGEAIMLGDNVSLAYEAYPAEPAETVAVQREEMATPAPQPLPPPVEARPEPVPAPPAPPPQVPGQEPFPVPPEAPPQPRAGSGRLWLFAGCGCLLLLACAIIGGIYAFDYLNLYCTPPFDGFFPCP